MEVQLFEAEDAINIHSCYRTKYFEVSQKEEVISLIKALPWIRN